MKTDRHYTPIHRILHWLIALAMPVLFITGFLRMNWMNKHHIVSIIESKTEKFQLPAEQMADIAKAIREPMWQWHKYFAFVVTFAFLARVVYMLIKGIRFPNPLKTGVSAKERLQGFTYVLLYFFIGVNVITGIMMLTGIGGELTEAAEAIHQFAIYWFPVLILIHLSGVVIAELTTKKGVVSKMIGGEG